jgi:regulatory protein spx
MNKKVILYANTDDPCFGEIREYLEEQEVSLQVHNIAQRPLNYPEISELGRHYDLHHFLNTNSKSFKKNGLDKTLPSRQEVIDLIARDNDLLNRPIIITGRLMAIGYNREMIREMLTDTPRETNHKNKMDEQQLD